VAPQMGAPLSETLVIISVFPLRSTSHIEALQTLSVACHRYQEHNSSDAPRLNTCCRLWCHLQGYVLVFSDVLLFVALRTFYWKGAGCKSHLLASWKKTFMS